MQNNKQPFRRYVRTPRRVRRAFVPPVPATKRRPALPERIVDKIVGGEPKGVVVAMLQGTNLLVGWSLCNVKSGDRFHKPLGTQIALGRIQEIVSEAPTPPRAYLLMPPSFFSAGFPSTGKTKQLLMEAGIAQTVAPVVCDLVRSILAPRNTSKPQPEVGKILIWTPDVAKKQDRPNGGAVGSYTPDPRTKRPRVEDHIPGMIERARKAYTSRA